MSDVQPNLNPSPQVNNSNFTRKLSNFGSNAKNMASNFGSSAKNLASNTGTTIKKNPNIVAFFLPLIIPVVFLILYIIQSDGLTLRNYGVLIILSIIFSLLSIFWKGDILNLNAGIRIYWALLGIVGLVFSLYMMLFDDSPVKSQCKSYVKEDDDNKTDICGTPSSS